MQWDGLGEAESRCFNFLSGPKLELNGSTACQVLQASVVQYAWKIGESPGSASGSLENLRKSYVELSKQCRSLDIRLVDINIIIQLSAPYVQVAIYNLTTDHMIYFRR